MAEPIGYLYCGEVVKKDEYEFSVVEIPFYKDERFPGAKNYLYLEHPYFTSMHTSTNRMELSDLNKELEISKTMSLFYSLDKQRCVDFVDAKYQQALLNAKFEYEKVKHAKRNYDLKEKDLLEEREL